MREEIEREREREREPDPIKPSQVEREDRGKLGQELRIKKTCDEEDGKRFIQAIMWERGEQTIVELRKKIP